ncbi:sulfurtransferase [Williamsia sp. MIQD14]|uniref:sulfurtransferase n=1 Tax=Williamsia sp. MIQD14 TaxID=3425703 RepID=UPI003DA11A4B
MTDVLISARELAARLADTDAPVVLDVRWQLGDPHGEEHYRRAHVPGAIYVDLHTELAAEPSAGAGRHPLPDADAFGRAARSWGVGAESSVVVYDDTGGMAAARLWWLLRWAGHSRVLILDGGLGAWRDAGGALAAGSETPSAPGDLVVSPGNMPTVDIDEIADIGGTLLDARAPERFRGETEPIDPRAGHIPGAVSAPTAANLDASGRFLEPAALRDRFARLGVDPEAAVTVYCGSGVTAAHEIAALAVAGVDAALYPGSWSQWSADPDRPAARGE